MEDDKRRVRRLKRDLKREGNRNRRRFLKRSLEENPDEAQYDDYKFGRDKSSVWNGINGDTKRDRGRDEDE